MFTYVTPKQYFDIQQASECKGMHTLKELIQMSKNRGMCIVCGQPVWRLGDCDMCFSCTTGEADNSDDYELVEK